MTKTRDRATGRYKHFWTYCSEQPVEGREFGSCDECGKVQVFGGGKPDKLYPSFEAAVKAEKGRAEP